MCYGCVSLSFGVFDNHNNNNNNNMVGVTIINNNNFLFCYCVLFSVCVGLWCNPVFVSIIIT